MAGSRFNSIRFNEARYNGGTLSETFSTDLLVFDGYSLNNGTDIIIHTLDDSAPSRTLLGSDHVREDGAFFIADYWRRKTITVSGNLTSTSSANLETLMETMKKRLRVPQANMDITRNTVVRRYIATLVNTESMFAPREHFHTTWVPFNLIFECRVPFAEDRGFSFISEAITVSPTTMTPDNAGTIDARPSIVSIIDSETAMTVFNVQRVDEDDNILDEIEVTPTGGFSVGDVLEIDSDSKFVEINGSEVDYVGSFPELEVGSNLMKFTITDSGAFSAYTTIKWKNRYL